MTETHCYRHADRPAGVTCQRCDRPICPSCMVTASVGFQCPECTKSGARQQRVIAVGPKTGLNEPTLTYALIGINVIVFLIGLVAGPSLAGNYRSFTDRFGLIRGDVANGEWWRLLTSGFMHGGLLHIGFNMYALHVLGGVLEKVVGMARFALVYFVSLVGGSLGVVLLAGSNDVTVGASGAIFGLFGAFAVLQMSRGHNPMQSGIGSVILLNLGITFLVPGISIGGHLGGLIVGAACGALLFGITPEQARERSRNISTYGPVVAGLGVLLFVVSIVASNALG